jgi:hypothetical protein
MCGGQPDGVPPSSFNAGFTSTFTLQMFPETQSLAEYFTAGFGQLDLQGYLSSRGLVQ